MTPPRPVDPVHFFNHRGESTLSMDHLIAENARLTKELEESQGRVKSLALRLRQIGEAEAATVAN